VLVHVADMEASLMFWEGLLGFRVRRDTGWNNNPDFLRSAGAPASAEVRVVVLGRPDDQTIDPGPGQPASIGLVQVTGVDARSRRGRFEDRGYVHLSFWVADLDAILATLAAAGVSPEGPVITSAPVGPVLRSTFISDPDGVLISLVSRPLTAASDEQARPERPRRGSRAS